MSDRLTTDLLVNELKEVTEWQSLGLNLGLGMAAIKEIEQDHQDMARRRMETLDRWVRKEAKASWVMVIEALEKMSELRLASKLREKYYTQQQITSSDVEPADSQAVERVLKVDRKEEVAQEKGLGEMYLKLVTSAGASLKDIKLSPKEVKIFSQCYLDHAVTSNQGQQADSLVTERVLMVDYRRDAFAREMESLRDKYSQLWRV